MSIAFVMRGSGSSPRGRGKLCSVSRQAHAMRLIPARAGKTDSHLCSHFLLWAHPRAGGENRYPRINGDKAGGSSPRGRGKPPFVGFGMRSSRLIPARAGKTDARTAPYGGGAHPRAGGENFALVVPIVLAGGSSPRGRGKQRGSRLGGDELGLIPARAGKTDGQRNQRVPAPGSSPRGRGKRRVWSRVFLVRGLIPARAGKTLPRAYRIPQRRAHPRAGGENVVTTKHGG